MAFVSRAQLALTVLGCAIGAVAIARREGALYDAERRRAALVQASAPPKRVATTGPVDLNTASLAELTSLPGVGPKLAARIVALRTERGPYTCLADLDAVPGVGEKLLAKLAPRVRF